MELYELLYEERFSANVLSRITKVILVFVIFCAVAANVRFGNPAAGQSISADADETLPAVTELVLKPLASVSDKSMIPAVPVPEVFPTELENGIMDMLEKSAAVLPDEFEPAAPEKSVPIVSEEAAISVTKEPAVSVAKEPAAVIPKEPAVSVPDEPAAVIPEEPEAAAPEEPAMTVPEVPAAPIQPEDTGSGSVPGVIDGFLVNESGIIYGISDPDLVVNDGYLEFPAEGCTGIAAGTFSGGFPSVREIFIPANITYIEEGAFAGLANMEWFETESAGAYYTEEGVLFSEGGTCLLAFPAGRTGNYKVPSQVTRFAAGAFDSAQLEVLDAASCTLTDVSGIPGNISLLVRETP